MNLSDKPLSKHQFICDKCNKIFKKPSLFLRHSTVHTKNSKYSCSKCSRTFSQNVALQNHLKNLVCQRKSKNPENVKERSITYCLYCDKKFLNRFDNKRHMRTHTNERLFQCEKCTKTFKLKQTLERHQRIHVESKSFDCTICLSYFKSQKVLNNHIQRLHNNPQLSDTSNKPADKEVIETVIGDFSSTILNRTFISEINQVENEVVVAEEIEVNSVPPQKLLRKDLKCLTCGKSFTKPIDLRRHSDSVHNKKKPFFCSVEQCGKSFSLKCTRNRHMQLHKEKRNLVTCDVCFKSLSCESSLKFHSRIHLNIKPLSCSFPQCALSFRTPGNLKSHLKTHMKVSVESCLDLKSNFMVS